MAKRNEIVPVDGSLELFDDRPIELPGFKFGARSVIPVGKPKLDQWLNAMRFAEATAEAAPYWWGDLMRYAETREDWRERMSQALSTSGLKRKTLLNYTSICNRVEEPERRLAPSISHADKVANLPREEQTEWLTRAREEELTVRDLGLEMKRARRRRVLEGQAVLEGMFRVQCSDPPWPYDDKARQGGTDVQYDEMTIEQIMSLPVEAHAHEDSVHFMWTTSPLLLQNPGPREVLEEWGFTYKGLLVWDKVLGTFGNYYHGTAEFLLIGTRGSCTPDVDANWLKQVQTIRRGKEHSGKPREFYDIIRKLYTVGPYLELFGRDPREGWTVFGNDAALWAQDAGR